jgi:prepilin-type N-terminal cleavage/methylation domain-containing protein
MKKFWSSLLHAGRKGFTMIELLVVIAILGVLSVVAISALDPIEQINKSRDTTSRADITQLAQGVDRFYANNQYYPWNDAAASSSAVVGTTGAANAYTFANITGISGTTDSSSQWGWATVMETGGEFKNGFVSRVQNTRKIAVMHAAGSSVTYVCFVPTSKAFKKEAASRCTGTTPPTATSPVTPCTSGSEMICVP